MAAADAECVRSVPHGAAGCDESSIIDVPLAQDMGLSAKGGVSQGSGLDESVLCSIRCYVLWWALRGDKSVWRPATNG